jgi:flavorubredoxin
MEAKTAEIADGVYRISTFASEIAPPAGFTFNQFLVLGDEPLLFHTGLRRMFPLVLAAVARIIPPIELRWISFGHFEADECGAMNEWLAAAPQAEVMHGRIGSLVSLNDMADRPPRIIADGEVIDLGQGRRVRYIDRPHIPHGWDAGVIYEEGTGTLLSAAISSPSSATVPRSVLATSSGPRHGRGGFVSLLEPQSRQAAPSAGSPTFRRRRWP